MVKNGMGIDTGPKEEESTSKISLQALCYTGMIDMTRKSDTYGAACVLVADESHFTTGILF